MIKFNFDVNDNNEIINYKNRGMTLEKEINDSNDYYLENSIALIYKKATPINIVKCQNNKIIEAYFESKSTTDYNGLYKGKYLDFEAKSTNSKTSFPLKNIKDNQVLHAKRVILHGGISFFIIEFALLNKYFILPSKSLFEFIKNNSTSSIPLSYFLKNAYEIKRGFMPPLDYLNVLKLNLDNF